MNKITDLHPKLTPPKVVEAGGELYVNVPGIIKIAREGNTPRSRALVRFYSAEWRALEGKPLSAEQRETQAFIAAHTRMARKFGLPDIDWSRSIPGDTH